MVLKLTEGQKKYSLTILNSNSYKDIQSKVSYKTFFSDTLQRKKEVYNVILSLWENGFISATCDSFINDSNHLKAFINIGNKYKYFLINNNTGFNSRSSKNIFNKKYLKTGFSDYSELQTQINNIILYYENNGYPFANVRFDSISITDSCFTGKLIINKNSKYIIDSFIVRGSASSSSDFIQNYLNIKLQSLYNEAQNKKITKKIKELNFIRETKPFEIEFSEYKAKIILFVDKVKANQFDGIIGFMPNDKGGGLVVTGDANLMLTNSFNRGEMIAFKWHKFDKLSQDMKISFDYPFLLSSPFGVDFDYSLYKKDTSYITNKENIGLKYIFEGNNYLKGFYEKQNTSLLSSKIPENDSVMPIYNATKINMYGIEFKIQDLNKLINPRKGYFMMIMASVGNKEIIKNSDFPDSIYNNIKLKSANYLYDAEVGYFIPLLTRQCLYLNIKSASIFNNYLFDNELFRIGGLKTLRGFDEESILASFYAILTVEYRYLLDEYSYFNVFWNGCHYEKNTISKYLSGNPFGFGAGINFKTKLGVFSINYALGKQEKEPLYIKRAKIHFGIINYF